MDESKRRDFVLVAGALLPGDLSSARQQIKALYLPGQRSIHTVNEKAGRQRKILRTISALDVQVTIYAAKKGEYKTELLAREKCLAALVDDVVSQGCSNLCLDRDETLAARDRKLIQGHLVRSNYKDRLQYTHDKATHEPLLLIPDAIAWAWPQGGQWKALCAGVIGQVIRV